MIPNSSERYSDGLRFGESLNPCLQIQEEFMSAFMAMWEKQGRIARLAERVAKSSLMPYLKNNPVLRALAFEYVKERGRLSPLGKERASQSWQEQVQRVKRYGKVASDLLTQLDSLAPLGTPSIEAPFSTVYHKEVAKKYGLQEVRFNAFPALQEIFDMVIQGAIDINSPKGIKQFEQQFSMTDKPASFGLMSIPMTDKAQWWLDKLARGAIYTRREPYQKFVPKFNVAEVALIEDDTNEVTFLKKKLGAKSDYGKEDTNCYYDGVVSETLWKSEDRRVPTATHRNILEDIVLDPDRFEMHHIGYDQYMRLAPQDRCNNKSQLNLDGHYIEAGGRGNELEFSLHTSEVGLGVVGYKNHNYDEHRTGTHYARGARLVLSEK